MYCFHINKFNFIFGYGCYKSVMKSKSLIKTAFAEPDLGLQYMLSMYKTMDEQLTMTC